MSKPRLYSFIAAAIVVLSVALIKAPVAMADHDGNTLKLQGTFSDWYYGATGSFKYSERAKNDRFDHSFDVKLENGPVNTSLDMYVNDQYVGTVTTDDRGRVRLKMKFSAKGNWQPVSGSFPTLDAGDVVWIGTASAEMTPR